MYRQIASPLTTWKVHDGTACLPCDAVCHEGLPVGGEGSVDVYVCSACMCVYALYAHTYTTRVEDLCVCDNNCTAVCTAAVIYLLLQVYCCCCWLFGGGTEYFISSVEKVLLLLSGNRVTPIIILS